MKHTSIFDHDLHIHSYVSMCSCDPEQNPQRILQYAEENGLRDICLTDHFWDSDLPVVDNFFVAGPWPAFARSQPLPQSENVKFHFGCEADLDRNMVLGVTPKRYEDLDLIIIATTHMHMKYMTIGKEYCSIEGRAEMYVKRLDAVLNMDLPFHKVGIAHPTCSLLAPGENFPTTDWQDHMRVLDLIDDATYRELFGKMAKLGVGFELNFEPNKYTPEDLPRILRPHLIAKECGCKFYFGSDAHHPEGLTVAPDRFRRMAALVGISEEKDIFRPFD